MERTRKEIQRCYASRDGCPIGVLYYEAEEKNAPLIVEAHGGGFIRGSNADNRQLCRELSLRAKMNVASLDYRYAPAVHYPWATYDAADAIKGLMADKELDFDRERIFGIGHSAGGNVIAGVNLLYDDGISLAGQVLVYPFLDVAVDPALRPKPEHSLPTLVLDLFNLAYFPDARTRKDPLASPARIPPEGAALMPPTLVVTCDKDSLRPDGVHYFHRLRRAGAEVSRFELPNTVHGYIEAVANGLIDLLFWISRQDREHQKDCYEIALNRICAFLNAHR